MGQKETKKKEKQRKFNGRLPILLILGFHKRTKFWLNVNILGLFGLGLNGTLRDAYKNQVRDFLDVSAFLAGIDIVPAFALGYFTSPSYLFANTRISDVNLLVEFLVISSLFQSLSLSG